MIRLCKILLKYFFTQLDIYSLYCLKKDSALVKYGWFNSFLQMQSIDAEGNPVPWFTYPMICFLKSKDLHKLSIFEYGAGNSTLWWASRVCSVHSCEHDKNWYEIIKNKIPKNVALKQIELSYGGEYCREILNYEYYFDIIVIDGRDRVNCMKNCLRALKSNGVIILDNSERSDYKEGIDYLMDSGFRAIIFEGMGPINTFSWCTTIFYKPGNCLGI